MKKLTIAISDEAHAELLKKQLKAKIEGSKRTTLVDVAADTLENCLLPNKKASN